MRGEKSNQKQNKKKEECPLCKVSEETLERLKGQREENLFQCSECGFWYREKEWAKKCEAWCKKHKSCNLEITKHAVKNK